MQNSQNIPIDLLALEALEDLKTPSVAEISLKARLPPHSAASWSLGNNKRITITRYNRDAEERYKTYETDTALGLLFEFRQAVERERFIVDENGRVHRDTE
jgi:hypothetical protein